MSDVFVQMRAEVEAVRLADTKEQRWNGSAWVDCKVDHNGVRRIALAMLEHAERMCDAGDTPSALVCVWRAGMALRATTRAWADTAAPMLTANARRTQRTGRKTELREAWKHLRDADPKFAKKKKNVQARLLAARCPEAAGKLRAGVLADYVDEFVRLNGGTRARPG